MGSTGGKNQWIALGGWAVLVFATAAAGAAASVDAASFYASLQRPPWAPPAKVFGPVWTVLYLLMTVAVWLVGKQASSSARTLALALFVAQLVLNALWSWLFFSFKTGQGAMLDVVLLLGTLLATLILFWRLRPIAGLLLAPYLAWVTFATALTWAVWQRNPGLL